MGVEWRALSDLARIPSSSDAVTVTLLIASSTILDLFILLLRVGRVLCLPPPVSRLIVVGHTQPPPPYHHLASSLQRNGVRRARDNMRSVRVARRSKTLRLICQRINGMLRDGGEARRPDETAP